MTASCALASQLSAASNTRSPGWAAIVRRTKQTYPFCSTTWAASCSFGRTTKGRSAGSEVSARPGRGDRVRALVADTIRPRVADEAAYSNAWANSDKENARVEHEKALLGVMTSLVKDDTQLFKLFMDDPGFNRWLTDKMFDLTYYEANFS